MGKKQRKKIPKPIDFCVTKWGKDRFAKGSYSYIANGANGTHYDKMSHSCSDKLFFAGEATIRKWPASVHGAYLSGIREARKIMNTHYIHTPVSAVDADVSKTTSFKNNTRRQRKR